MFSYRVCIVLLHILRITTVSGRYLRRRWQKHLAQRKRQHGIEAENVISRR